MFQAPVSKTLVSETLRRCGGRLFHRAGPEKENAHSPNLVRNRGVTTRHPTSEVHGPAHTDGLPGQRTCLDDDGRCFDKVSDDVSTTCCFELKPSLDDSTAEMRALPNVRSDRPACPLRLRSKNWPICHNCPFSSHAPSLIRQNGLRSTGVHNMIMDRETGFLFCRADTVI